VNFETNPEARKVRFDVHQPISRFSPRIWIWNLGFIFLIPDSEEINVGILSGWMSILRGFDWRPGAIDLKVKCIRGAQLSVGGGEIWV
jgi:hypothetical protein